MSSKEKISLGHRLKFFVKNHAVVCIAATAALVTCFFVPPDREYLGYFDWKTLSCLFITLAVVCALRNVKFFTIIARKTVNLTGNLRVLAIVLVVMTFLGSMVLANDMALITFLPIGYYALSVAKKEKYSAFVFVLQNISANLGGMLTPFGNPQNLYIYTKFNIPAGEFTLIMLPLFLLAVAMLVGCCFFLKPEKILLTEDLADRLKVKKTVFLLCLFAVSVLCVFRLIDYRIALAVVTVGIIVADRRALLSVDYPLLFTFFFFFIFSGNLARTEGVKTVMEKLLSGGVLLPSLASCQFISNVPTAVLLSRFTDNYRELLYGVNIGGTGTLIASLASIITYSEFKLLYPGQGGRYMKVFTLLNAVFLFVLGAAAYLLVKIG